MSEAFFLLTLWLVGMGAIAALLLFCARQQRKAISEMIAAIKERGPINVHVSGSVPLRTRAEIAKAATAAIESAIGRNG